MPRRKGKFRWGAVVASITTLGGAIAVAVKDPTVIASLPGKVALGATVFGAVWQAVTKPVARRDHER
jgi:hypothetical protein